jgi:D-beta-D-heptose 7-phosphate kinase/D-beta-D-heptose 1-phosphate adenosyltransferase
MEGLGLIVDRFDRARVVILGDLIIDQYIWGKVSRISPEAPIPVVEVVRESFSLGGAANVATNLHALGASVEICGIVGDDPHGKMLLGMLEEKGIDTRLVIKDSDRSTILKTRIVAHKQQVVRVDREDTKLLEGELLNEMKGHLRETIPGVDALILEDYGKGVIQERLLAEIVPMARELGKIVTVDPKRDHFDFYRGVTAITPNRLEAEEATGIRASDQKGLHEVGVRLLQRLQCEAVLITMGDQGMCLFKDGDPPLQIPARAREVYDVSGAGDTVIAVFTSALVAGATFRQAAMLSNVAGGLVVEKLGTAVVTREEIRARMEQFTPLG